MSMIGSAGCLSHFRMGNNFVKASSISTLNDAKMAQKFVQVVRDSDIKALKRVIKKKLVDIDEIFRFEAGLEKMTALHYAAKEGMLQLLKELLNHGCDVNKETPFDAASALHFACHYPCRDTAFRMVSELIRKGSNVNQTDHSQSTPLIIASELGHYDLVRLLLENGAEIDHHTTCEDYPIAVRWSLENLNLSEKETDEMCDPFMGNNALLQACREHHLEVIRELLHHGCSINVINTVGNTPIHIACKSESRNIYLEKLTRSPVAGHIGIIRTLIEKGCDLNPLNKHHETPLRRAIDGILEVGQWNINEEDRIAETRNFYQIIQLLITAGSDVTIVDGEDHTLLFSLLQTGEEIKKLQHTLHRQFDFTIHMLVYAGCPVKSSDLQSSKELIRNPHLLNFLIWKLENPFTLKQACRMVVRRHLNLPLMAQVPDLQLPTILKRYLVFEILD